jgi:large subunit ribosomal protein L6e
LRAGPFKANGVPLRRVNQAYVIATSVKVDVAGVDVSKFDDAYFARAKAPKKGDDEFFADKAAKKEIDPHRIADQKAVDDKLMAKVAAKPNLKEYLSARFSLTKGMRPHEMKF